MNTEADLSKYLETVLGQAPDMDPLPDEQLNTLPLYLRRAFRFARTRIHNAEFIFAFATASDSGLSPSEYQKRLGVMEKALGLPTVLVFPTIPAYQRNRLVQRGVPFVVPGRQLFLPMLFIDLRERFDRIRQPEKYLSTSAQVLLLYHLLGNQVTGIALQDLARTLGYSAMTMSNVRRELEDLGFVRTRREGKSLSIIFADSPKALWMRALEKMTSPVRRTHWVRWQSPVTDCLMAGSSALATMTPLGEDRLPTYAIYTRHWKHAIKTSQVNKLPDSDDANARIEEWKYNPRVLSTTDMVDPLSLYLSLRSSPDERILAALDQVLEGMPW